MEEIEYDGIRLELPSEVCCDYELLAEIITPDTWNNCLDDDNRQQLMSYLPTFPNNDLEEKTHTLQMFFMDVNFRFGTPLRQFHQLLQNGHFNPAIAKYRRRKERADKKIWRYQYCEYLHRTLEETIIRREEYLGLASSMPPDSRPPVTPAALSAAHRTSVQQRAYKRYCKELHSIRQECGAGSLRMDEEDCQSDSSTSHYGLSKKQRKQLCNLDNSLPQHLLPIRHTHSSGSLSKDVQLLLLSPNNSHKSLTDLPDVELHAMIAEHVAQTSYKRDLPLLWHANTGSTNLHEVMQRIANVGPNSVTVGGGVRRVSPVVDSPSDVSRLPPSYRPRFVNSRKDKPTHITVNTTKDKLIHNYHQTTDEKYNIKPGLMEVKKELECDDDC